MEKMNLTYLSPSELKEIDGGLPLLVITLFIPSYNIERVRDFIQGIREGYQRAVSN